MELKKVPRNGIEPNKYILYCSGMGSIDILSQAGANNDTISFLKIYKRSSIAYNKTSQESTSMDATQLLYCYRPLKIKLAIHMLMNLISVFQVRRGATSKVSCSGCCRTWGRHAHWWASPSRWAAWPACLCWCSPDPSSAASDTPTSSSLDSSSTLLDCLVSDLAIIQAI